MPWATGAQSPTAEPHQEALRNARVAEATVAEALRMVGSARKVVLHVNPEELAGLEKTCPGMGCEFTIVYRLTKK